MSRPKRYTLLWTLQAYCRARKLAKHLGLEHMVSNCAARLTREFDTHLAKVRGLYVYQANGPDELDVKEGEMIELSSGATGGQNYSDGWWEGA